MAKGRKRKSGAVAGGCPPIPKRTRNHRTAKDPRYPHVARMARQFLGCPATSASAERVFSLAGRLYSDLRQHKNDGTLEERMWAKVNHGPNK